MTKTVSPKLSSSAVIILAESGLFFRGRKCPTNDDIIGRVRYSFKSNDGELSRGIITGVIMSNSDKNDLFALIPDGSLGNEMIHSFQFHEGSGWCAVLDSQDEWEEDKWEEGKWEEFKPVFGELKLKFANPKEQVTPPTKKVRIRPTPQGLHTHL